MRFNMASWVYLSPRFPRAVFPTPQDRSEPGPNRIPVADAPVQEIRVGWGRNLYNVCTVMYTVMYTVLLLCNVYDAIDAVYNAM